MLFRICK